MSSSTSSSEDKTRRRRVICKCLIFLTLFWASDRGLATWLTQGLRRAYGINTPAEVVCIGHSHTALGIDAEDLTRQLGARVVKFALNGANAADRLMMIQYYLQEQSAHVNTIVYDVDAHTFTGAGLSQNSYSLFYPFMDAPLVRQYIRRYAPSTAYMVRRLVKLARFNLNACNASLRGWLNMNRNLKYGSVDLVRLRQDIVDGRIRPISFDPECIRVVEATLDLIAAQRMTCVLLYIPTIDVFNQAEPDQYAKAIQLLEFYAEKYENVTFLNYNVLFAHQHDLFYDPIHLNPKGRARVTQQLGNDLARLRLHPMAAGDRVSSAYERY